MEELELDDSLQQFLAEEFDVSKYTNVILGSTIVSDQLKILDDTIERIDQSLQNQVISHQNDLLQHVSGIETLEGVLQGMQTRILALTIAVNRIRAKVTEPYKTMQTRVRQLKRLQETCDLLRIIIRVLSLAKRLKSQKLAGVGEISKMAQNINELDYLMTDCGVNLNGIQIIDKERQFIADTRLDVERQASSMLSDGLKNQNQAQTATALQVFHNLGTLNSTIGQVCKKNVDLLSEKLDRLFDFSQSGSDNKSSHRGPGRAPLPLATGFRANLWSGIEKFLDEAISSASQVDHLLKVLCKKRDPVSRVRFIDELQCLDDQRNLLLDFWFSFQQLLMQKFSQACQGSNLILQTFESEYPKLLQLFIAFTKRVEQFSPRPLEQDSDAFTEPLASSSDDNSTKPSVDLADFSLPTLIRSVLSDYESAYLSRSLSRLFDPINLVFHGVSADPPSMEDLENIVKTISSELNVGAVDSQLAAAIAHNVCKTVRLFAVKSEEALSTGEDACQIIGPVTEDQARNVAVINLIHYFRHSITQIVSKLSVAFPPSALSELQTSIQSLQILMQEAIEPLMLSIVEAIEAILLTMHDDRCLQEDALLRREEQETASPYMKELLRFLLRVKADYLAPFDSDELVHTATLSICERSTHMLINNVTLIRRPSDDSVNRLCVDCSQLEQVLPKFLLGSTESLKDCTSKLSEIRKLLKKTDFNSSDFEKESSIGPYVALQLLLSRGPPEILSPQQVFGGSLKQYLRWVDERPTDLTKAEYISRSLENYSDMVKRKGQKEYATVYPVMAQILTKLKQNM